MISDIQFGSVLCWSLKPESVVVAIKHTVSILSW